PRVNVEFLERFLRKQFHGAWDFLADCKRWVRDGERNPIIKSPAVPPEFFAESSAHQI
ncbi:MAG: hypothetical protein JWM97_1893, partial [Phycisphaerales bacterium]|nr:hypothetical protein [Phycisphaerales bacterium]